MFDVLSVLLEAMSGKPVPSGDAPGAANSATRRMAQGMLAQAAGMDASPDPAIRKMGRELRARASAVLGSAAPSSAPAPVSRPPAAPGRPAVAAARTAAPAPPPAPAPQPAAPLRPAAPSHLLAEARTPSSLLRTIVLMEALGAPLALRDELGGPFTHR